MISCLAMATFINNSTNIYALVCCRKIPPTALPEKCGNISQIKFDLWLLSHPQPQPQQEQEQEPEPEPEQELKSEQGAEDQNVIFTSRASSWNWTCLRDTCLYLLWLSSGAHMTGGDVLTSSHAQPPKMSDMAIEAIRQTWPQREQEQTKSLCVYRLGALRENACTKMEHDYVI